MGTFDGGKFQDVEFSCGKSCLGSADNVGCISGCISKNTGMSLSCATCSGVHVMCVINHCLTECIADKEAPACMKCRCGANSAQADCEDDYGACMDVSNTACEPG